MRTFRTASNFGGKITQKIQSGTAVLIMFKLSQTALLCKHTVEHCQMLQFLNCPTPLILFFFSRNNSITTVCTAHGLDWFE